MDGSLADYQRLFEMAQVVAKINGQCVTLLACAAGQCQEIGQVCPPKESSNEEDVVDGDVR